MNQAIRRGVIAVKGGIYGNVIRFLVPLVIPDEQLDEALTVLGAEVARAST